MKHAPLVLITFACAIAVGHIASAQTPPPTLVPCTRLPDPGERLRCYDSQMTAMGAVVANSPPAPTVSVPRSAIAAAPVPAPAAAGASAAIPPPPPPSAAARFGEDTLAPVARPKAAEVEKVLLSKIASIREARPKVFVIVLENGQTWLQEGTQITSFFRAGYEARIERGLLGDYRMSTEQTGAKNMVRVTRIK